MSIEGRDPLPYRLDDSTAVVELRINIDGKSYLCREVVDSYLWETQLASSSDALRNYLIYFLHKSLGGLAQDSRARAYFLSKIFVIQPGDSHDLQRCLHSNDGQHPDMWPRCLEGFMLTELPGTGPVPGVGGYLRRDTLLGYCPCRCHQRESDLRGPRPYVSGVGVFDEDKM